MTKGEKYRIQHNTTFKNKKFFFALCIQILDKNKEDIGYDVGGKNNRYFFSR